MSTIFPEDLILTSELIFIPGVGFRGEEECTQKEPFQSRKYEPTRYDCTSMPYGSGKLAEFIYPPAISPPIYSPPAIVTASTPTITATPITPITWTPPTTWCCTEPPYIPPPEIPPVPLPHSLALMLTAVLCLLIYRRLSHD